MTITKSYKTSNLSNLTFDVFKTRNERKLSLDSKQLMDLHNYIDKSRKSLLKLKNIESESLIISGGRSKTIKGALQRLMIKLRKQNSNVISHHQLVSSIYSIWVSKYNLRKVQYMTGHRYVSSTERYKKVDLKGLQKEIEQFFPNNLT